MKDLWLTDSPHSPQFDMILLACYWYFDSRSSVNIQYISMNTVEVIIWTTTKKTP